MKRKLLLCAMAMSLSIGVGTNCMAFESVKIGSHGDTVVDVQNALISLGYLSGGADGSFGSGTEAAVIKFQEENELDATGVVGEATYKKIMSAAGMSVEETSQEEKAKEAVEENVVSEQANSESTDNIFENVITGETFTDDNFTYEIIEGDKLRIVEYHGTDTEVTISSKADDKEITEIGNGVFMDNTTIEKFIMWAKPERIGNGAFKGCTSLEEFSVSSDTKSLGESCFEGCTSLESVILWGKLETFPDNCFKNCIALEEISISSENKYIGISAFENCTSLEAVTFWGGENIGAAAFRNCTKLDDVSISSKIKYIGPEAFAGCTSLEDVTIWDKKGTEIVENAFSGCPFQPDGCNVVPVPDGYVSPTDNNEAFMASLPEEEPKAPAITDLSEAQSLEDIRYYIETKGEELGDDLETRMTETIAKVAPYSNYKENYQSVKDYYSGVENDSQGLYDLMKESAVVYYEMVRDTVGLDDYSAWNSAMDDFYKTWNDTMDDYYKDWNGSYEDIYGDLDDIISDGYDVADYSEVSDAWSAMYDDYSTAWGNMYDLHSNSWSYMYTLHSEVWGGMYDGDLDIDASIAIAEEELAENEADKKDTVTEPEEKKETEKAAETEVSATATDTSSDGVSAEFKEAMDSYEKFFDDYVDIMQKMADNPSDSTILAEYTEFMGKYTDTMTKFEAIEDSDMNDAETAYYIEVQTRINQKLLGAIQ